MHTTNPLSLRLNVLRLDKFYNPTTHVHIQCHANFTSRGGCNLKVLIKGQVHNSINLKQAGISTVLLQY